MDSNMGSPFGKQQTEYNLFRTNKKLEDAQPGEGIQKPSGKVSNILIGSAFGIVILAALYFLLFV